MSTNFPLALPLFLGLAFALAFLITLRPEICRAQGGKVFAFIALFIVPVLSSWTGLSEQLEHSKRTEFCLSCHEMADYGRSLYLDDPSYLPAAHFQNRRIPRDEACYTCHTDYTMFGDLKAKWRGFRHLYVHYVQGPPQRGQFKLYAPYNNRECLYCHAGARSFEEAATHNNDPSLLNRIKTNAVSCMSSNCHDFVHDVTNLAEGTFWQGAP